MSIIDHGDIIDMRDLFARYDELVDRVAEDDATEDDRVDLADLSGALRELGNQLGCSGLGSLRDYAENEPTLISADYFADYAQDLADELGLIDRAVSWPLGHIDWEAAAEELYNEVDLDGRPYLIRS